MHITSKDLWDKIEEELILFQNKEDLDPILSQRFESLINHFNGNMARDNQHIVIEELRMITSALSQKSFYKLRNFDKEDILELTKINEDLMLLDKVLVQESKTKVKEENKEITERLPNINNDKSLKLFEDVRVVN